MNVVAPQSLYKFFQYGLDLTPMGATIAFGPILDDNGADSFRQRMIDCLNVLNMGPGLSELALTPPIDSGYIEYRARLMQRNATLVAQSIKGKLEAQGVQVRYPGIDESDREKVDFIGFSGPYLFVELPGEGPADTFIDLVENRQKGGMSFVESGASFGYDATRVERFGKIIRIAVGTETLAHIHLLDYNLRKMLQQALNIN